MQNHPFGKIVHAYTRAKALADGFQVEVTKQAVEAGIRFPVFLTRAVFDAYVTVAPGVTAQDEAGRLWDIVWMLRLAFRIVVRLEQALRFHAVLCLEARLFASDFVLEIKHTPRTPNQTELLFHCFTHGCECGTVATSRVSEQWASVDRAEAEFCKGCQTGEESGETLTSTPQKPLYLQGN